MNNRLETATTKPSCAWQRTTQRPQPGKEVIRVLIADDEPFARAALVMLLKSESDFEIVGTATNGGETLQAIRSVTPDVIFLDVSMPGMDGFEVLERAGRPKNLAVIFTTSDEKIGAKAYDLNALDYLLKPFSRARFKLALDRARARFQGGRIPPCILDHVTG